MQDRSLRTRNKVVVAASTLFASRGYRATVLSEVAAHAGVTTGALYFHFSSKEALARYIVEEQHRISNERAQAISAKGYSAIDTLTHFSASMGFDILTDPIIHAGTSLSTETQIFPELYTRPWEDWITSVRHFLRLGITQGDVDPASNVESLAHLIGPAFAGVRIASEVLQQTEDLLLRLRGLSEAFIPAFATDARKQDLIQDAHEIFDEYQARFEEYRSNSHNPVSAEDASLV